MLLESYTRQCLPNHRPLLMWVILLTVSLVIVGLIVAAPIAHASQHGLVAATLYQAFSHVCHQQPERSFFILGRPLAVCARCTGIYSGFALTTLLYPLMTPLKRTNPPARKWLFIAAAPLAIDFVLGALGIWENTHWSRLLTGAIFGSGIVFFVMPALAELSQRLRSNARVWNSPSEGTDGSALAK
jgi:uncharacterized membrane protein